MKTILTGIFYLAIFSHAHATPQYPHKIFINEDYMLIAGFSWPDQKDNVLYIRVANGQFAQFSLDDLGMSKHYEMTSAGSRWYQNSIGFHTTLDVLEGGQPQSLPVFYFRHWSGHEVAINLLNMQLINLRTIIDRKNLREESIRRAANLLESQNPCDLQTAAIHLGQLRSLEHLPALNKLIENPDGYIVDIFGSVEYIREAAQKAVKCIEDGPEEKPLSHTIEHKEK